MRNLQLIIIVTMMLIVPVNVKAQNKFQEMTTESGVIFYYKWKHEKCLKKDSPLILKLKLQNTNEYKVEAIFTVDYFYKTLRKSSSKEQSYCIKSQKSLIGDVKKSGFDKGSLTNEQLLSDDFIVELSAVKIIKSANCKKNK